MVSLLIAIHLLAMNVASAGPLAAAWLAGRGGLGPELARRVARQSLQGLGLGIVLGGALLLAPNAGLRAALGRFPASTYWFAAGELVFSAVVMAGLLWIVNAPRRRPVLAWGLALVSASNLLYHFPPLMAVIGKLAADPRWATEASISHAALLRLVRRPDVLALWLHFILASIAAAAIVALWPSRSESSTALTEPSERILRQLAAAALVATLAQLPVGVWLLTSAETAERNAMLGQGVATSTLFLGSLVAAFVLLHALARATLGDVDPTTRRRSAWLLLAVVVLMSATLTASRRAPSALRPATSSRAPS
jgi:hypothetical protein